MTITATDVAVFLELSLAAGRVGYSLTQDEIFRPVREAIYLHSAPHSDVIVKRGDEGDLELPARMVHRVTRLEQPDTSLGRDEARERFMAQKGERGWEYMPQEPLRKPGMLGQLFECPFCMTFWTSLFFVGVWALMGQDFVAMLALPFATWALANLYAVRGL